MEKLLVDLGERSYPIYVGQDILSQAGTLLKEDGLRGKIAIVTNPTVAQLYLDRVHKALTQTGFEVVPVLVPDGEEHKNLDSLATVYDCLISERFERNSCVMALGGGVIGDLAGFAAATFLRGVRCVQVPTTLLAQVDSSVGGKTGVNHRLGKNLIGAFHQPRLVLADVAVLETLPHREFVAGLAEVIKYGIIRDPFLFHLLEEQIHRLIRRDRALLIQAVVASCAIKARVVERDEREENERAVLNFGHTIGHALESATGYSRLLHGEAVAIGMAQAAAISFEQRLCDTKSFERIQKLLHDAQLPCEIPEGVQLQTLVERLHVDKKTAGGRVKFVMCEGIGKTRFHWLTPDQILAALERRKTRTLSQTADT